MTSLQLYIREYRPISKGDAMAYVSYKYLECETSLNKITAI